VNGGARCPAGADLPAASPVRCPLCGYVMDVPVAACAACPLHKDCRIGRCPHCGYSFIGGESAIATFLRRLFRRRGSLRHAPH
jgi:hypothetical protein